MRSEIPVRSFRSAVVHFNERLPRGVPIRPEIVAAVAVPGGDSRRQAITRPGDGRVIILWSAVSRPIRHVTDQSGLCGQAFEIGGLMRAVTSFGRQPRVVTEPAVPAQSGIDSRFAGLPLGIRRGNSAPARTTEDTRLPESLQVLYHIAPAHLRAPGVGSELKLPMNRDTAVFGRGGEPTVIFAGVHQQRGTELFVITEAFDRLRLAPRLIQRRQQHCRQNRDDRDDHEQLDEGKPAASKALKMSIAIYCIGN